MDSDASATVSHAKLVVVDGPGKGQGHVLEGLQFTIGRQDGNDLQLLEAAVSRRHCELRRSTDDASPWELYDLDSAHGTLVNGLPVGRKTLGHGDFVQVGGTVLLFLNEISTELDPVGQSQLIARSTLEKYPEDIAALLRGPDRSSSAELAVLLDIATAAQELRDPGPLAEHLLDRLGDALPAEQGALFTFAPGAEDPVRIASQGPGELVPSATVLARVRDERVALLWDDVHPQGDLAQATSLAGSEVRSLLAAPLVGRHDLHGVVYFQSPRNGAFAELHLDLVATAAALAGLAFDTARAFDTLRQENRRLREAGAEHGLVGESPAMEKLLDFIARVALVDSTVLLRGDSGTGKELAARALHRASPRAEGPFVAINCATLSETLLESELFGHERGAFTGAVTRKTGKLEAADGGTLFLDEVGEMPTPLQARLLRVLQERRFERVGATRPIEVDVRVIAATNRDLEKAMRDGSFREDLFYRLNVIAHTLPPLRERREDIALLTHHFVHRHGERLARPGVGIEPRALRMLTAYDWPGNIRQLSNAVERALVLGDSEMIRPEDLPDEVLDALAERSEAEIAPSDYQAALTETKKRLLTTALAEADGNAAEAARRLGLHPNSFRRLVRQLGLRDHGEG